MFEDLCYDVCPLHTYPFDKLAADELVEDDGEEEEEPVKSDAPPTDHPTSISNSLDGDKLDPLQAEDRRRRSALLIPLVEIPSRICAICDRSCLACYGPMPSQCSTCAAGSQLRKIQNETFCYAYVVRSTGSATVVEISKVSDEQKAMDYMTGSTVLLMLVVVFTLVGVVIAGGVVYHRRSTARSNELYARVALIGDDGSGSDSDDELYRAHFTKVVTEKVSLEEESSHLVP